MARFLRAFALVVACLIGAWAPHGLALAHVVPAANPIVVVPPMGGVAAWTPTTPGTPLAWYDFSDLSTLFSSNACTGATSNGGTIGCITDKSGNGRSATQATAGVRPTRTDNSANSKTGATFGGAHFLQSGSFTIAEPCTVVLWVKSYTVANTAIVDGDFNARQIYAPSTGTTTFNGFAGTVLASSNSVNVSNIHMVAVLFASGTSGIVRVDGTEATGTIGTATSTGGFTLGAAGNGTAQFSGVIMEAIVYGSDIGSTHRGNAQTYGQGKYAAP